MPHMIDYKAIEIDYT